MFLQKTALGHSLHSYPATDLASHLCSFGAFLYPLVSPLSVIHVDLTLFFVEHVHSPTFNSFQFTAGHTAPSSQTHI